MANYALSLRSVVTSVDSLTFKIVLAEQLRAAAPKVWIADLHSPDIRILQDSRLQLQMADLRAARSKVWGIVGPMISALVQLDTRLDHAAKNKHQEKLNDLSVQISALRRDLQPVTDPLKETDNRLAAMEKLWAQVDSATGFTVLARMLKAESLRLLNVPLLHCDVVASAGSTRTIRNLW